ncbi:MAG: 50S ribosomal protein L35 [Phototrophicales bacterium]|nr:MAG: 50S ribosomal protein L35 [Phototrophicales bacterium]
MQKTKKSIAKRFKVTGTGKIVRRRPNARHLLRNKTVKQPRKNRQDQPVSKGVYDNIRHVLPKGCAYR